MSRSSLALCSIVLVAFALSARADEDFEIPASRRSAVGNTFRSTAKNHSKDEQTVARGEKSRTTVAAWDMESDVVCEVLAVDGHGLTTKARGVVNKWVYTDSAGGKGALPAGTIIVGEQLGDVKTFTVGGAPASKEMLRVLEYALPISRADQSDLSAMFPVEGRKRVGDTWPVDADAAVAHYRRQGATVAKGDISGSVKLAGVVEVEGVRCLDLRLHFTARRLAGERKGDWELTDQSYEVTNTTLVPVDAGAAFSKASLTLGWKFEAKSGQTTARGNQLSKSEITQSAVTTRK